MKTLRTIAFVMAGNYILYFMMLLGKPLIVHIIRQLVPEQQWHDNPFLTIQASTASVGVHYGPWLLIGAAVCLLVAVWHRLLYKAIPAIAICLTVGGIIWFMHYNTAVSAVRSAETELIGSIPEIPKGFSRFVKASMNLGMGANLVRMLLPGFLLMLFWWRARKDVAA